MLTYEQQVIGGVSDHQWIQISIGQFYGIEINDFAVTVAKTALWIAEAQMMEETESIVHMNLDLDVYKRQTGNRRSKNTYNAFESRE